MNAKRPIYGLSIGVLVFCGVAALAAQSRPATQRPDPRVGLKAGIRDAGQAIRNMELVASMPKPAGFFDPQAPLGRPTPPEPAPAAPAAAEIGRAHV